MNDTANLAIHPPALPKGGGAIHSVGNGFGTVGATGAATISIALPISGGRGFAPALSLGYSSQAGKSEFGQGWQMPRPRVARRTGKGTPRFDDRNLTDDLIGPTGEVIVPEIGANGQPVTRTMSTFRGASLAQSYTVTQYLPRVLGEPVRIESWRGETDGEWFWLMHDATGAVHVFGKRTRTQAPSLDPDVDLPRIAEWWLDESVAPNGEQIRYEYARDDEHDTGDEMAQHRADAHYLQRVCYGNAVASLIPPSLLGEADDRTWHFELVFDFGERATGVDEAPTYAPQTPWPVRQDPFSSFGFGFEVRKRRLCHQVLMFHRFDELGDAPVLVRRTLLEYDENTTCTRLSAAHEMGYDADDVVAFGAPLEFTYTAFTLPGADDDAFVPMPDMPGMNDGEAYQLVDLYGEGIAGVLHRASGGWYYREPMRAEDAGDASDANDGMHFGPLVRLDRVPISDAQAPMQQTLTDLTGDGRLDWLVVQPGFAGYFSIGPDREWSTFLPFAAFPTEFTDPRGQLADLTGAGLQDFAMIGPRSVRLYANRREAGFAAPVDIAQESPLPGISDDRAELIAFADFLGAGQSQLVRVRHDGVTIWPNLGHGRFGAPRLFGKLPFDAEDFDVSHVRLADLDGSGAVDLIYLRPDAAQIFRNGSGNGWSGAGRISWPAGVRYDRTCQVSIADLQGLGCASLVLSVPQTVPHLTPRHWRCDFAPHGKPYLLEASDNNMGLAATIRYRSSAQEWLDEKRELTALDRPARSGIPFPIPLVAQQSQVDQITGGERRERFQYRQGYYDPVERELHGFALVLHYDSEQPAGTSSSDDVFTAPQLTRTWYHVGRDEADDVRTDEFDDSDPDALPLGPTLCCHFDAGDNVDTPAYDWDNEARLDMARALSGSVRRVEIFGMDVATASPYTVAETRHLIRMMQPRGPALRHSVVRPLVLETREHHYERQPSDPRCDHSIGLRWDAHGAALHAVQVHYARREGPPPFDDDDVWQIRWWQDAHDDAQRISYVSESKLAWSGLDTDDQWRAAMPWRSRVDALAFHAGNLPPSNISYESFIAGDGPLTAPDERELGAMSEIHYVTNDDATLLLAGLVEYEEHAELDAIALSAYDDVLNETELDVELEAAGYVRMQAFLPEDPMTLWAVHRDCTTYGPLDTFHHVRTWRQASLLGDATLEYDAYHCAQTRVVTADGCATQAVIDYRTMQPVSVTDPNRITQEARYDGLGRLVASTIHGTIQGQPAGFMPMSDYLRDVTSPDEAIAQPQAALQDVANAWFFDALSWMGRVEDTHLPSQDVRQTWARHRWVTPQGYVRASARARAEDVVAQCARRHGRDGGTGVAHIDHTADHTTDHTADDAAAMAMPDAVAAALLATHRRPPHGLHLLADRYPDDPERQIRMHLVDSDGFARTLQEKQLVPPGAAYQVLDDGSLAIDDDGQPVVAPANPRWRVSERVEYDNKGLVVRAYRPYFANSHRYVDDAAMRMFGLCDRQSYDPLGRPTVTVTAAGYLRRETYWPWHTVSEDENDTAHEREQARLGETGKASI
ncbi:hypothetical protein UC34_11590 [Pandoraea vervacti]|uniref:Toxin n=1 Tax=Pandoraea vervacti TaxID=656178 RepID=A0ABM5SY57_9BURK|nr:SpvB/TcaC N-terminal domain-containing protein [Pandoraea vervacti]AJP57491.1 hypothetical protein UC34_11590 [Pandoraea vervacti]